MKEIEVKIIQSNRKPTQFGKQVIDNALYIIDTIRPEIEKGNFRSIYRYTQQLEALTRYAAIVEERESVGRPIIRFGETGT